MTEPSDELGAAGHLTAEQLDELATQASADIDPADAAASSSPNDPALDRHLAGCPRCRTALGDQVAVQAWLRRIPDVGQMPADVSTRIDAALAGARAVSSAAGNVLPLRPPEARGGRLGRLAESRLTKSLVAAAAIVLIAAGGYAAINRTGNSTSTASGSADSATRGPKAAEGGASDGAAVVVRASGTAYTKQNVVTQVQKQLSTTPVPVGSGFDAQADGGATTLTTPAGLEACLTELGYPTVTPLLVDLATFAGKPVAVVVLPGDSRGRQVWVVGRTCSAAGERLAYYTVFK
jgi:hypothetical protein